MLAPVFPGTHFLILEGSNAELAQQRGETRKSNSIASTGSQSWVVFHMVAQRLNHYATAANSSALLSFQNTLN